jgi:hypothetical protein
MNIDSFQETTKCSLQLFLCIYSKLLNQTTYRKRVVVTVKFCNI